MSHVGYLKLLVSRSILSGPLDFEIKRVACTCNTGISVAMSKKGKDYIQKTKCRKSEKNTESGRKNIHV